MGKEGTGATEREADNGSLSLSVARIVGDARQLSENGERLLHLANGGWGEIDPPGALSGHEGTISFGVKPLWRGGDISHPLLSMRWGDPKRGYLIISQGWWEPEGARRLYFVLNNELFAHCSAPIAVARGEWSEITVTWRGGPDGFCRLYVNGDRVAETRLDMSPGFFPAGPMFIGSDKGTSLAAGRFSEARFRGFTCRRKAVGDREVELGFLARSGGKERAESLRASWNRELLAGENHGGPHRDHGGAIRESRAIFDEDMEWATSRSATDRIIGRIREAGFNVYIPCVWHGGNPLYPTPLAPMPPALSKSRSTGDDPLGYLIEQAHANGIEVHPWFEVMRRDGGSFPEFAGEGAPAGAYDVHKPRFRAFIVELITDLARRYPVDGINLDYMRSMGNCAGRSCRADYFRVTGRELSADIKAAVSGGEAARRLDDWNGRAVEEIMAAVSKRVRAIKPDVVISVDSALNSADFRAQGNNATHWANKGLVDQVYHMDYGRCPDWDAAALARKSFFEGERMILLLAGFALLDHGVVPFDGGLVADFVRIARGMKFAGVGFYHRPRLSLDQAITLSGTVFRETARPFRAGRP